MQEICYLCHEQIESNEDHYSCEKCENSFCINCYENEDYSHPHEEVYLIKNEDKMEG